MAEVVSIEPCDRCAPLVAALRTQNAELQAQLSALTQRVAALEDKLRSNSTNSNKPPSSDGPGVQRPKKDKSKKQRGAQPGHEGKAREMLPPERVDKVVEVRPVACERCETLLLEQAESYRPHQVTELPKVRAEVTEYRLLIVRCPCCEHKTEAPLPPEVPRGVFGPQMQATVSWASAELRLSKRKTAQVMKDLYDAPICVGSVVKLQQDTSEALRGPVEEAKRHVLEQGGAKHIDETGWKQGKSRAWLWVVVSGLVAVFAVRLSRGSKVAKELLGSCPRGSTISDRFSAYNWICLFTRQLCWSHLLRDFEAAAERDGPGKSIAKALLKASRAILRQYKRLREADIGRSTFRTYHSPRARAEIHELLVQGRDCTDKKLSALCRWLLKREAAMWTFTRVDGVEPTNNAAERALRHAVLWRKQSYGTQSQKGSEFVERMLTVVTTLRLQKRNVLEYLTDACRSALQELPAPSLLPSSQPQTSMQQLAATGSD